MSIHSDGHEPQVGTFPPFGDNLEGKISEEDGVDQRAEPPSWLPDGAVPRTGASADLRSPEADETSTTEASEDQANYAFSGDFSGESGYSNGQDSSFGQESTFGQEATFGQGGTVVGGYTYEEGDGSPNDATAQVPPYPAAAVSEADPTASTADDLPAATATADNGGQTAAFSAPPRASYQTGGSSPAAAAPLAGPNPSGTRAAAAKPGGAGHPPARRAELVVARLEPWSVMKFSFLMSLVAWVVLFVAVALLYFVLSGLGVFDSIQHTLTSVTSSSSSSGMKLSAWFSASRVLGYTMLLGAINIILITALSTVGAMIYNLVTHLGGGIEVTLRETD
jgi:hypothetical protein